METETPKYEITITKTPYPKCARCWKHERYVGTLPLRDVCGRCYNVLFNMDRGQMRMACESLEEFFALLHTFDVPL